MKEFYWLALVPVILTPFAIDLYNYVKNKIKERRIMSESQVKDEIARICISEKIGTRENGYEFTDNHLDHLHRQLIKRKSKDRLPEVLRSQYPGNGKAALFRLLETWVIRRENYGTCPIIYKLPVHYRNDKFWT